jgi:hypothetical protein
VPAELLSRRGLGRPCEDTCRLGARGVELPMCDTGSRSARPISPLRQAAAGMKRRTPRMRRLSAYEGTSSSTT